MATPRLSKEALDYVKRVLPKYARQILLKVLSLAADPEPSDSKCLQGLLKGYRRADVGEHRIIYRVEDDELLIALIGKRNDDEAYRTFARKC